MQIHFLRNLGYMCVLSNFLMVRSSSDHAILYFLPYITLVILNLHILTQDVLFLAERNEIHAKFSESILDMQQKSGLKYMVLEKKITAMREELDVKDAQMHEIVKASQLSDRGNIINLLS